MPSNRSYSAPPVEKFILEDDIELDEIQYELKYTNYYKKNRNPRLEPPRFLFSGQSSIWATEHNDFIIKAFRERKTAVEMIDLEFPESGSCSEFSGKSRAGSPIGEVSFVLPNLVQRSDPAIIIPITCTSQKVEQNSLISELKEFYEKLGLEAAYNDSVICVSICKDQEGSRYIQGLIDSWNDDQITYFFEQIVTFAFELSTNLFGNYVIQKIIPRLKENHIFTLLIQFFGHICELSLHVYGCRVVQKLIDHLKDIKSIVAELESNIAELIASPNGNHVIQKCIDKDIDKGFLLREFEVNCVNLAQQRYGCRVLQRIFEVCSEEETLNIYFEIIKSIDVLINDKYGNYVIQHLIQSNNKLKSELFDYITKNCFSLSKDKFSSNVVEKCVNSCTNEQLELFFTEFSQIKGEGRPCLYYMCVDMYANYVVQRFFDVAQDDMKTKTKNLIKPYIKDMRSIPYTKHIISRLV
ncbi:hypothetical protein GINT2_002247 [Glugoides intestinalis]